MLASSVDADLARVDRITAASRGAGITALYGSDQGDGESDGERDKGLPHSGYAYSPKPLTYEESRKLKNKSQLPPPTEHSRSCCGRGLPRGRESP